MMIERAACIISRAKVDLRTRAMRGHARYCKLKIAKTNWSRSDTFKEVSLLNLPLLFPFVLKRA